jgi:site-specific DNA-methyltransferase (adenine-specific)
MIKTTQSWEIGCGLELLDDLEKDSVTLMILDLPYFGVVKDEWDNQWKSLDDYLDWCKEWFVKSERALKDNGSLYYFNSQFKVIKAVDTLIESYTALNFRQFITIDKGLASVAGRTSVDALRSYPNASEYMGFYTFDDFTGSEMLSDEIASRNPMAKYLKDELARSGVAQGELRKLFPSATGGETGCVTNWIKGYNCILKFQYEIIRDYLNRDKVEYLRREYEDLRREYEDLRYPFNLQTGHTDVWYFNFYKERRHGHPTQKPFDLIKRIVLTSSNVGDLVCDPAMGTGTTMKVCKVHDRNFIGAEIASEYEEAIRDRCMTHTPTLQSYFGDDQ